MTVLDVEELTITGYDYNSAVLHIHSFLDGLIRFTDSPKFKPRMLELDTATFKVNRVIQL